MKTSIWLTILLATHAQAGIITKTYTFSDGSVASASAVNTNFDQLFTEINSKETRLTTLEGGWAKSGSAVYYNLGNVGIGTSTPAARLSVGSSSQFQVDNSGNITAAGAAPGSTGINSGNGITTAGGENTVYNAFSATVPWPYNGAGRSSVFSAQNQQSLNGGAAFTQYVVYNGSGNAQQAYVGAVSATGAAVYSPSLVFGHQTNANNGSSYSEFMRIDANGNVGIGTTLPTATLDMITGDAGFLTVESGVAGAVGRSVRLALRPSNDYNTNGGTYIEGHQELAAGNFTSSLRFHTWDNADITPVAINGSSVGIGITNPSYTLHVVGTAGLSTGTAWTNASDIRLKDLHGDYEYGLDEVMKLHTVRFTYKKDNPLGLPSDHPMTGFIAQEVEKVIPDAVHENKNGYLELNVDPIHWAVVNAVKELKALIDGIYERLAGHDQAIADLAAKDVAKGREIAAVKVKDEAKDQKIKQLEQENAAIRAYLCAKDPGAAICQ